tara:strand:+ start:8025 stop:8261 length:237 start_codon:yes stop_codon:yes gene_type:complete
LIGTEIRGLHQGQANRRHQQAGYMEAPDQVAQQVYFPLLSEGRPYMESDFAGILTLAVFGSRPRVYRSCLVSAEELDE